MTSIRSLFRGGFHCFVLSSASVHGFSILQAPSSSSGRTTAATLLGTPLSSRLLRHSAIHPNYSKSRISMAAKPLGSKSKVVFVCESCGAEHIKWLGRCPMCKQWNTIKEFKTATERTDFLLDRRPNRSMLSRTKAIGSTADLGDNSPASSSIVANNQNPWIAAGGSNSSIVRMDMIDTEYAAHRVPTFSEELDRVLGGGLVRGSVTLLAGEPGIGKSTLLLQVASHIAACSAREEDLTSPGVGRGGGGCVYASGEETPEQIASRAKRLSLEMKNLYLICDIEADNIVENVCSMSLLPDLLIVDSVQTMYTATCSTTSAAGSISQIRDSTARFVQLAKTTGVAVLIVGHVTKSGEVAGPRVLEHMVDTVLYLEGSERADYRLVRSMKNRFGSVAEVGVFAMSGDKGMEDVTNPSALFLSSNKCSSSNNNSGGEGEEEEEEEELCEGSAVAIIMEGSRPVLAEVQCLVSNDRYAQQQRRFPSYSSVRDDEGEVSETSSWESDASPQQQNQPAPAAMRSGPKRASDGFPYQRLLLILAVIEKRLRTVSSFALWSRDVYVNVVGGLRVSEPSSDLAVAVAVVSSLTDTPVLPRTAFIGEIGLQGELRSGGKGERSTAIRIREAEKLGFRRVILPKTAGLPGGYKPTKTVVGISGATSSTRISSTAATAERAEGGSVSSSSSSSDSRSGKGEDQMEIIQCSTLRQAIAYSLVGGGGDDFYSNSGSRSSGGRRGYNRKRGGVQGGAGENREYKSSTPSFGKRWESPSSASSSSKSVSIPSFPPSSSSSFSTKPPPSPSPSASFPSFSIAQPTLSPSAPPILSQDSSAFASAEDSPSPRFSPSEASFSSPAEQSDDEYERDMTTSAPPAHLDDLSHKLLEHHLPAEHSAGRNAEESAGEIAGMPLSPEIIMGHDDSSNHSDDDLPDNRDVSLQREDSNINTLGTIDTQLSGIGYSSSSVSSVSSVSSSGGIGRGIPPLYMSPPHDSSPYMTSNKGTETTTIATSSATTTTIASSREIDTLTASDGISIQSGLLSVTESETDTRAALGAGMVGWNSGVDARREAMRRLEQSIEQQQQLRQQQQGHPAF